MKKNATDDAKKDRDRLRELTSRLKARAGIIDTFRATFGSMDFVEVDTPTRISGPAPEQHIDAIESGDSFLITSPELQMKRLLGAGFDRIYQICHCFRGKERGERHLPEFTMVEWYRTGANIFDLMTDCETLITAAAKMVEAHPRVQRGALEIDLSTPWERLDLNDAFERYAGWRPGPDPDPDRFDMDLVEKVEPALSKTRPVFLTHYPASMAALARISPIDPTKSERFELYIGGLELANGFTELTDAEEQRARFEAEIENRQKMGKTVYPLDERFLGALTLGLPDCAGIALGMDRLVMLLTGAETIDDVVAFPEGSI